MGKCKTFTSKYCEIPFLEFVVLMVAFLEFAVLVVNLTATVTNNEFVDLRF